MKAELSEPSDPLLRRASSRPAELARANARGSDWAGRTEAPSAPRSLHPRLKPANSKQLWIETCVSGRGDGNERPADEGGRKKVYLASSFR